MDYKIIAILCDMDDLTLRKVPIDLYNEIRTYLNDEPFPRFQKLYDSLCFDDVDPIVREFYDKICKCDVIDCELIQEY